MVFAAYAATAKQVAREFGSRYPLYWAAVWRDARHNAEQMNEVQAALANGSTEERLVARLPLLRVHDILVWSHLQK